MFNFIGNYEMHWFRTFDQLLQKGRQNMISEVSDSTFKLIFRSAEKTFCW